MKLFFIYYLKMEENDNDNALIINSGSGKKSIGSYVDNICKQLIEKLVITIKAYDNNMNKLITIEQIIKRALNENHNKEDNDLKIKYEIGKDKDVPYIKCNININKDDIDNIKKLIGNKNNKRNNRPFTKSERQDKMEIDEFNNKNKIKKVEKKENKVKENKEINEINELCLQNIHEFFK